MSGNGNNQGGFGLADNNHNFPEFMLGNQYLDPNYTGNMSSKQQTSRDDFYKSLSSTLAGYNTSASTQVQPPTMAPIPINMNNVAPAPNTGAPITPQVQAPMNPLQAIAPNPQMGGSIPQSTGGASFQSSFHPILQAMMNSGNNGGQS